MKEYYVYAEHTPLAGRICRDQKVIDSAIDVYHVKAGTAIAWSELPATDENRFRRTAGRSVMIEAIGDVL
jgi:hypothetical protein